MPLGSGAAVSDINAEMASELMDLRAEVQRLRTEGISNKVKAMNAVGLESYLKSEVVRPQAGWTISMYQTWADNLRRGVTARMLP